MTDYEASTPRLAGAIDPAEINWHSWGVNGALTRLIGRHTLKFGADFRWVGLDFQSFHRRGRVISGSIATSHHSNPLQQRDGHLRQRLRLVPAGISCRASRAREHDASVDALEVFTKYYGGYAQDDFRVSPKLTLNYGLRLEHQDGLQEQNDGFTVAFDRDAHASRPARQCRAVQWQPGAGGLVYAGVNGANTYQGNPPAIKVSPRSGSSIRSTPRRSSGAGYGIYWAPKNAPAPNTTNYGQVGYNQETLIRQGQFRPTVDVHRPVPRRTAAADRQHAGRAD